MDGMYTKEKSGYEVFVSNAVRKSKGDIALLWVKGHNLFKIESVGFPTADILTFKLVTGDDK